MTWSSKYNNIYTGKDIIKNKYILFYLLYAINYFERKKTI